MPEQSTIELRILETDFTLKVKDNENHIKLISDYVSDELNKVKAANPFTNHIRIAILGCMNIAEKYIALQEDLEKVTLLQQELKDKDQILESEKEKTKIVDEEKELLLKELDEKNELLNQYREHLRQGKVESEANRKTILELQNQLFESQIELVKVNKNHIEKDIFKSIEDKIKAE
ncbi:MAG: cell division protein ZapA [Eubacteriaceae bacterium]